MKVKIKKLDPKAIIPKYAKVGDAGLDLTATFKSIDEFGNISYETGLSIEIPEGYVGLLFPRSSICKYTLALTNSVGIIDSSYRGNIMAKFKPTAFIGEEKEYEVGDRICQLIILPYPSIELEEVVELSQTERGESGYGNSGS